MRIGENMFTWVCSTEEFVLLYRFARAFGMQIADDHDMRNDRVWMRVSIQNRHLVLEHWGPIDDEEYQNLRRIQSHKGQERQDYFGERRESSPGKAQRLTAVAKADIEKGDGEKKDRITVFDIFVLIAVASPGVAHAYYGNLVIASAYFLMAAVWVWAMLRKRSKR